MKADLQTHTDGAWIPLHSDNRNISLNSVAVTLHRSYGSRSLSNNLVMAASELGQRQWTWGPQFVRMRSQEYIYKNTNHCYTNTADIVRKTDFIISLTKVCNSFKLPFHIHCRQWNHLISKYTAISIYKNTKLKMVKIWICTNYLTHRD